MATEPNAVEQAVSRTLRDNLGRIQRSAEELHQAVNDLVAACASSRPSNALPSMVRAQTSAAALSATLEVLSKFVTSALQPPIRLPFDPELLHLPSFAATSHAAPVTEPAGSPADNTTELYEQPVATDTVAAEIDAPVEEPLDEPVIAAVDASRGECSDGHAHEQTNEQPHELIDKSETEPNEKSGAEFVAEPVAHSDLDPAVEHVDDFVAGNPVEPVPDHVISDDATYDVTHDVVTYEGQLADSHAHPIEETPLSEQHSTRGTPETVESHSSVEPTSSVDSHAGAEKLPVTEADGNFSREAEGAIPGEPEPPKEVLPIRQFEEPTESGSSDQVDDDGQIEIIDDEQIESETPVEVAPVAAAPVFSLDSLPPEEQELHRRAFRVAKVSMQDIKMLRPEDVRLGRENKDLCFRLRDDIEKAHKEYERRFQSIKSHPVDYFYDWMVEILAGGDSQALGEYPYSSAVLHR